MEALGLYALYEVIARGPSSVVWRAGPLDGRGPVVAIKRGPGLEAEAAALGAVEHPHVVQQLEVLPDGDGVAIVMPFAEGGSLEALLARRGRLTPADAVAVLAPLTDALDAVHRIGIVHGDVKPANVLLDRAGAPLLTDFGAAGQSEIVGSAAYLDPCLLEQGRPDPTNDIYSLGVVAHRALTGALPHTGASDDEVLEAARRGAHQPLLGRADVPYHLAAAVDRALALDPRERPSAERFAVALRGSVTAGGITRTFGPRPARPELAAVSKRRASAIGLAVAAALGIGGVTAATVAAVRVHRSSTVDPTSTVDTVRPRHTVCPVPAPIEVPSGGLRLEADLRGDGCEILVLWDGSVMQVRLRGDDEPRRYDFRPLRASRRSGALLLGDWDCDGADSPAFYDPATGQVHYFALVPRSGELSAQEVDATGVEDGRPRVRHRRDGCDRVEVRPAT